jgi:alpha-mannosidase
LIVAEGQSQISNLPGLSARTGKSQISNSQSLISVDCSNIVVETIKQAEDGHGIIVRFYEFQRQRGPVTLTASFDLAEAWHTNLLEENQTALTPVGRSVSVFVKPYEIVTLRLANKESVVS